MVWIVDQDSSVDKYFITVSKNYNGDELSNGIIVVDADQHLDKQSSNLTLNQRISISAQLIISIWAKNKVGLNSTIFRATVLPSLSEQIRNQSGALEFEKHSCKIHSCNQDCTCSAVGKFCTHTKMTDCVNVNASVIGPLRYPKVKVYVGAEDKPEKVSASSACLFGYWKVDGLGEMSILRFEWSMGMYDHSPGEGIFSASEKQWHDVGKRTRVIFCSPQRPGLIHGMNYSVYVKAWYSPFEQFVFSSDPITIDHTPPQPAKARFILDSNSDCDVDYDVIDWMDTLTFCWKDVFRETQSQMSHFAVSLGTSINGSDIFRTTIVGLDTSLTLQNMTLSHGTKYFFTVTAYNVLGLQNSLSSDGFVIDMDTPISGVVFNTDHFTDYSYQSSTSTFAISWHGFIDQHSGIKTYHVAISEEHAFNKSNIIFKNVYLKTKHTFNRLKLEHGKRYFALVKAYDAAGHVSGIAKSAAKLIDVTAPISLQCNKYALLQQNETYIRKTEKDDDSSNKYIELKVFLKKDALYKLSGILYRNRSLSKLVLIIDRIHLVLHTSYNHDGSENFEYSFRSHHSKIENIKVQTVGFSLENYSLHVRMYGCLTTSVKDWESIQFQQIGPSAVSVASLIFDPESSMYKVQYGIGTTAGGLQMRPFSPFNDKSQCVIDMHLIHGSKLYLTVLAENNAGLISNFTSSPIIIDKTPPIMGELKVVVNESNSENSVYSVSANWQNEDLESGIKSCFCSLGIGFQMEGIESLKPTDTTTSCRFFNLTLDQVDRVYVKVLCINNVELQQELVSDPIFFHHTPTKIDFAKVRVLPATRIKQEMELFGKNITEVYLQSDKSQVKFEWDGFEDIYGIDHYEYRFLHNTNEKVEWRNVNKHTMVEMVGMHLLTNEVYLIDVRAVNSENCTSEVVSTNLLISEEDPKLTGNAMLIAWSNRTIHLDWSSVFQKLFLTDIVYDVTIGSRRGFSDVVQLQRLGASRCSCLVPEFTTVSSTINEIFVFVTAKYSTGFSALYEMNIKI